MEDITNSNLENNKKYMQQKEELADIVAKTGQLLPAFQKAYKNGNIDVFKDFINENSLQETFVQNSFNDLMNLYNNDDDEKRCFIELAEKEGLLYLNKVYGNEFGKRLKEMYKNEKVGIYDIYAIADINKKDNTQKQGNIMMKLLDLYNDDNLKIGIHRTGEKDSGKILNQEGINLTGHLSSGVMSQNGKNLISRLEDNISFDYGIGELLSQIAHGGNYKNYLSEKFIDISIIAIPKFEIENKSKEIIIEGNVCDRLNPKFIKGYITVDSKNNTLENYVENPIYLSKENKLDLEQKDEEILSQHINDQKTSMIVYKKQNRFISWLKEKFNNIKEKFSKNDGNNKLNFARKDYIYNQEEKSSQKNNFINNITQNGKLKSKEQQRKQFEIVKKWEEQNKQEIDQEENNKNL